VNLSFPEILPFSLQFRLRQQIQTIIHSQHKITFGTNLRGFANVNLSNIDVLQSLRKIPLNKVKEVEKVWYVSAIAFQRAQIDPRNPIEIAEEIVADLIKPINLTPNALHDQEAMFGGDKIWQRLQQQSVVWVKPPGWICWQLTPGGVAEWLQLLIDHRFSASDRPSFNPLYPIFNPENHRLSDPTNSLFLIQHSHARCCSLLRLADREHLITLASSPDKTEPESISYQIVAPHPIPWMADQTYSHLTHAMEYALIAHLVSTLDSLCFLPDAASVRKLAQTLSQSFQRFYAACPMFVDRSTTHHLAIAQSRLGLVLATQRVLRFILEDGIGQPAPTEL
jgi:DALR anticodon binding domain